MMIIIITANNDTTNSNTNANTKHNANDCANNNNDDRAWEKGSAQEGGSPTDEF